MSQILSFEVSQPSRNTELLRNFPEELGDDYHVQKISDGCFEITSTDGGLALYQYDDLEVSLEGGIDDDLYTQFAALCEQHDAILLLEGDSIAKTEPSNGRIGILGALVGVFVGLASIVVLVFSLLILPFRLLLAFTIKNRG